MPYYKNLASTWYVWYHGYYLKWFISTGLGVDYPAWYLDKYPAGTPVGVYQGVGGYTGNPAVQTPP